jgi:hypothetical protein
LQAWPDEVMASQRVEDIGFSRVCHQTNTGLPGGTYWQCYAPSPPGRRTSFGLR